MASRKQFAHEHPLWLIFCFVQMPLSQSTELNAVGWELDVLLGSVQSTVHNRTPEKCMHDGHKACHMERCLLHLKHYVYQGQQFLHNTVTRNERSVNVTPKTDKYLRCGNTSFPLRKTHKALASVRTAKEFPWPVFPKVFSMGETLT